MMTITIFSPDFIPLGLLDKFTAFSQVERAYGIGSFTLWCPLVSDNSELLQEDNLVWIGGESISVIEVVKEEKDQEGNRQLEVSGRFIDVLLTYRTIWDQFTLTGPVSKIITQLVYTQSIEPLITNRKIDYLGIDLTQVDLGETISYTKTGGSLSDEILHLSTTYKVIPSMEVDVLNKSIKFKVTKGANRSIDQDLLPRVVLSTDLSDIMESSYLLDTSSFRGTALVAGAGEGLSRKRAVVGDDLKGTKRRELYVDARDLSDVNDKEIPIDPIVYQAMLVDRGKTKLGEFPRIQEFSCTIKTFGDTAYTYGQDYFLGDTITMEDKELMVIASSEITEVETNWSESGIEVNLTFGNPALTISKIIKRG